MEVPRTNALTTAQQRAVAARGNVLVMAGAGTGKTKTLVARCLDCLECDGAQMDELLIVTFTEAAAAELRERLRTAIEQRAAGSPPAEPSTHPDFWHEQLARFDFAHIGTLHGFCFKLVREHFYELGLDPRLSILDEGESHHLANETLEEQFQSHYEGGDEFSLAVQEVIQIHGGGRDESLRQLVLRLHHYSQGRPDAAGWLARQRETFAAAEPAEWRRWLLEVIANWRDEWLPALAALGANVKAAELADCLKKLPKDFSREAAADILAQIVAADGKENFPKGKMTALRKPLEDLFDEAEFLRSLATIRHGVDPLVEDWSWVCRHMETLLRLAEEFAAKLDARKRADSVVDFHDLEQYALTLLWDFSTGQPTATAMNWREKLKFIFVDEYQDINAAQDKIIAGLSRNHEVGRVTPCAPGQVASEDGAHGVTRPANPRSVPEDGYPPNRFLVGDVKQSIYRFRLADPQIFRDYAAEWHGGKGETIPLAENFRSSEGLLNFVNSLFRVVMRKEVGGVAYDADAELKFGEPEARARLSAAADTAPRTELLVRFKTGRNGDDDDGELAGLSEAQREARMVAGRLKEFIADQREIFDNAAQVFRPMEWRDMTILLRSPRGKSEIFAREFERAGVPLQVARGGFYQNAEILDLTNLLQLLDNPLQDVPCIAVLRSPLAGLSLDELAQVRLAARDKHFWTALNRVQSSKSVPASVGGKTARFLERFSRWRKRVKQVSLSQCLEGILAETFYTDWLRAQTRGAQRAANVAAFLRLAQRFDQFQRQGLYRFLKFIEAQQEADAEPEVPATPSENAVRLMSIHQSKGLEFPVVVLADLAKNFNEQDLRGEIIFDEHFGLCPKVKPPQTGRRYPSLPHWLAQRRQRRELRGEELRLFYVALTRARDYLILAASLTEKSWAEKWMQPQAATARKIAAAKSFGDWLALWTGTAGIASGTTGTAKSPTDVGVPGELRWQIIADENLAGSAVANPGELQTPIAEPELSQIGDQEIMEALRARLEWEYPFGAATTRQAKASVTALRREAEELDDEAEPLFYAPLAAPRGPADTKSRTASPRLSAAEIGAAHHKFLQYVALEKMSDLAAEAARLKRENYLTGEEHAALDLPALARFWGSDLGRMILAQAGVVRRELPFTARFTPAEIAEVIGTPAPGGLADEFIVVQGVADLVVLLRGEIWLVDFKTDQVGKRELPDKIRLYTPQLLLYAAALEKIFSLPVTLRALHFLAAGRTEQI